MPGSGVLVVLATKAEAAHVPTGLRTVITGLGKTAAAVATTRAILEERPSLVINVGSAGALRDGLHGLFEIGRVLNHDMSADIVRTLGYDPREWLTVSDHETVLASGDVFVTDPVVRERLALQAHLVDMEGYAVAYACHELGVPLRMVKHVSDQADESAMDWPDLVELSAKAIGAWLEGNL
ncbi:MAG TPA: nucleosidase [Nocardioidaceae bacterium]|nr:nucleosidase [Nocardioidaceae bacterium]